MTAKLDLPFEVGQVGESQSFIHGFRGAWFRCKIMKIAIRHGEPYVALEYFDFPDEKVTWMKLFQKTPSVGCVMPKKQQLMLRPCFPPVYRKSEIPNIDNIAEMAVIAEDEWKVGDLVDWWTDGCYWSGRVIKILKNEKLQIELLPPPEGEGSSYDVSSKDLRPSLAWSLEGGWTLPAIMTGEHDCQCAQLIKPVNEGQPVDSSVACEARKNTREVGSANASVSSQTQLRSSSLQMELIPELGAEGPLTTTNSKSTLGPSGSEAQKTSSSNTIPISDIRENKEKAAATSLEKLKYEGTIRLNSTLSDTLQDAVLDLETLISHFVINKVAALLTPTGGNLHLLSCNTSDQQLVQS